MVLDCANNRPAIVTNDMRSKFVQVGSESYGNRIL